MMTNQPPAVKIELGAIVRQRFHNLWNRVLEFPPDGRARFVDERLGGPIEVLSEIQVHALHTHGHINQLIDLGTTGHRTLK